MWVYEFITAPSPWQMVACKNPAITTTKNCRESVCLDREVEIIKLEDAISIHQDTKN